jgi:hypothetical protein
MNLKAQATSVRPVGIPESSSPVLLRTVLELSVLWKMKGRYGKEPDFLDLEIGNDPSRDANIGIDISDFAP